MRVGAASTNWDLSANSQLAGLRLNIFHRLHPGRRAKGHL